MTSTDTTKTTQKPRAQLDDFTCGVIIGRFQANESAADIHRAMGIPRSTISDCINRWKKTGTGAIKTRSGRPLKLSEREQRAVARSFRDEPSLSFVGRAKKLKAAGINIHSQTLTRYASMNGLGSKKGVPKMKEGPTKKKTSLGKKKGEN